MRSLCFTLIACFAAAASTSAQGTSNIVGASWTATTLADTGWRPPDMTIGVSPTQVLTAATGRVRLWDRAGNAQSLNVTTLTFFASVANGTQVINPHVVYDRLSSRWFVMAATFGVIPNRLLLAVSTGSTISGVSSFSFYQFAYDQPAGSAVPGAPPGSNPDTGKQTWESTFGVDANALYIGGNSYDASGGFTHSSFFVIRKSSLLTGTLKVTAFRNVGNENGGMIFPMPATNDDPAATEGVVIGVDGAFFSKLIMRRVFNPGSDTPTLSAEIPFSVWTTDLPILQPHKGSAVPLTPLDDRIASAMIKRNRDTGVASLWVAHLVGSNINGASDGTIDRNTVRWYEIRDLNSTPSVAQTFSSGYDSAATNPFSPINPSLAVSGQGREVIAFTEASTLMYPTAFVDEQPAFAPPQGVISDGAAFGTGAAAYNLDTSASFQRWGHYSTTIVDPSDDQTFWTIQQYVDASNSYALKVAKVLAPPPATPAGGSAALPLGRSSVVVTLTGTSVNSSAFFDPGSGFPNRLAVSVSGGVTVNSVTYLSPTSLSLDLSTVGATAGAKNVTVTNPDGQSVTGVGVITVGSSTSNPTLTLERTRLAFTAVGTGSSFIYTTPVQAVRLSQIGAGTVTWTAKSTDPWLTVTPASGTGPATLSIGVQWAPGLPTPLRGPINTTGAITLTFTGATTPTGTIDVTLTLGASSAPPFGSFDTPANGASQLQGSLAITGWALDDIGIARVELWRDLQPGETTPPFASTPSDPRNGKIFIGNALFVDGARPDVEGGYPSLPAAYRAGWGYLMLTWGLWNHGNGTYTFYAFAFDVESVVTLLGQKTVGINNAAANKPFGSLDSPGIGGDPGTSPNFGWALTPNVNGAASCRIRSNGVQVSIDSGPLQPVVYGDARADIAGAFPGFSNTSNAGGHFVFDWSTLTNGPHTIGWLVTDDCNRSDGIGSRFFTVTTGTNLLAGSDLRLQAETSASAPFRLKAEATESSVTAIDPSVSAFRRNLGAVLLARGYGELPVIVVPDEAGMRTIEVKQGERIELRLPRGFDSAYQLGLNGDRRALPIGSTWDEASQTFYWQPAPGFLGPFQIEFSNGSERVGVRVVVRP